MRQLNNSTDHGLLGSRKLIRSTKFSYRIANTEDNLLRSWSDTKERDTQMTPAHIVGYLWNAPQSQSSLNIGGNIWTLWTAPKSQSSQDCLQTSALPQPQNHSKCVVVFSDDKVCWNVIGNFIFRCLRLHFLN